jgi:hypothetical protein
MIDGRVFCVHGGLSPNLQSIDQVRWKHFPIKDSDKQLCLVRSVQLIANKKFHTMDLCVTSSGPTQRVRYCFAAVQTEHVNWPPYPARHSGLGSLTTGSWLSFRFWYHESFCASQCYWSHRKSSPTRNGRVQTHVRSNYRNSLECAELLLPVRILPSACPHNLLLLRSSIPRRRSRR